MLNEHPGDDLGINPGPSMRTVSFLALAAAGANTPQKEFTHIGILKTILKQQLKTNETGNKTGKSKINSQGYSLSVLRLDLIIIPIFYLLLNYNIQHLLYRL